MSDLPKLAWEDLQPGDMLRYVLSSPSDAGPKEVFEVILSFSADYKRINTLNSLDGKKSIVERGLFSYMADHEWIQARYRYEDVNVFTDILEFCIWRDGEQHSAIKNEDHIREFLADYSQRIEDRQNALRQRELDIVTIIACWERIQHYSIRDNISLPVLKLEYEAMKRLLAPGHHVGQKFVSLYGDILGVSSF